MPTSSRIISFLSLDQKIRSMLSDILGFNSDILSENINAKNAYSQILGLLDVLKSKLSEMSTNLADNLIGTLGSLSNELENTFDFHMKNGSLDADGKSRMLSFLGRLNAELNTFLETTLSQARLFNTESEEEIRRLHAQIDALLSERSNLASELNVLKNRSENDAQSITDLKNKMEFELKEFDERYKTNLGNYELLSQEKIFREESDENGREAKRWIIYILVLVFILLGVCVWFMYACWLDFTCLYTKRSIGNFYGTSKWQLLFYYELLRPVAIRVFMLSIIVMLLKAAIKNYNAAMHNRTVNMHKANSLAAMIRVILSLSDENTRNTLINLAGKEIFMHQKTGYLRKEEMKIDLNVLEKFASIFQKKES